LISHSGPGFFTLPINYSIQLHTQLWEQANYGNGYDWETLYKMPIHWRKFYYNLLLDSKKKEAEEAKKANNKGTGPKTRVRK
jgi:hypothetical protein